MSRVSFIVYITCYSLLHSATSQTTAFFRPNDIIIASAAVEHRRCRFLAVDNSRTMALYPNITDFTLQGYNTTADARTYQYRTGTLTRSSDFAYVVTAAIDHVGEWRMIRTNLQTDSPQTVPLPVALTTSMSLLVVASTESSIYVGGFGVPLCHIPVSSPVSSGCTADIVNATAIVIFNQTVYVAYHAVAMQHSLIGRLDTALGQVVPLLGFNTHADHLSIRSFTFLHEYTIFTIDNRNNQAQLYEWTYTGTAWEENSAPYVIDNHHEIFSITSGPDGNSQVHLYAISATRAWKIHPDTKSVIVIARAYSEDFTGISLAPSLLPTSSARPLPSTTPSISVSTTPESTPTAATTTLDSRWTAQLQPLCNRCAATLRVEGNTWLFLDFFDVTGAVRYSTNLGSYGLRLPQQIIRNNLVWARDTLYFLAEKKFASSDSATTAVVTYHANGTITAYELLMATNTPWELTAHHGIVYISVYPPVPAHQLLTYDPNTAARRAETLFPGDFGYLSIHLFSMKVYRERLHLLIRDYADSRVGIWVKSWTAGSYTLLCDINRVIGIPLAHVFDFYVVNSSFILVAAEPNFGGSTQRSVWVLELQPDQRWVQVSSFPFPPPWGDFWALSGIEDTTLPSRVLVWGASTMYMLDYSTGAITQWFQPTCCSPARANLVFISFTGDTTVISTSTSISVSPTVSLTVSVTPSRSTSRSADATVSGSGTSSSSYSSSAMPSLSASSSTVVSSSVSSSVLSSGTSTHSSTSTQASSATSAESLSVTASMSSSSTALSSTTTTASNTISCTTSQTMPPTASATQPATPSVSYTMSQTNTQTITPTPSLTQAAFSGVPICGMSAVVKSNVTLQDIPHTIFKHAGTRCCIHHSMARLNASEPSLAVISWRLSLLNGSVLAESSEFESNQMCQQPQLLPTDSTSSMVRLQVGLLPVTRHCGYFINISASRLNTSLGEILRWDECFAALGFSAITFSALEVAFDGSPDGTPVSPSFPLVAVAAGVGIGLLAFLCIPLACCYFGYRRRKLQQSRTGLLLSGLHHAGGKNGSTNPSPSKLSIVDEAAISAAMEVALQTFPRRNSMPDKSTFAPVGIPTGNSARKKTDAGSMNAPLTAVLIEEDLVAVEDAMQSAMAAVATAQPMKYNKGNVANVTSVSGAHAKDRFELLTSDAGLQAIAQSMSASSGVRMDVLQAALLVGMHIAKSVVYGDDGTALESGVVEGQEFLNPLAVSAGSQMHASEYRKVNSVAGTVSIHKGAHLSVANSQRVSASVKQLSALSLDAKMIVLQAAICAAVKTATTATVIEDDDHCCFEAIAYNAMRAAKYAAQTTARVGEGQISAATQSLTFTEYVCTHYASLCKKRHTKVETIRPPHMAIGPAQQLSVAKTASKALHAFEDASWDTETEGKNARPYHAEDSTSPAIRTMSRSQRNSVVRFNAMKVSANVYRATQSTRKAPQVSPS